ncbi:MAG: isoprenylcysteine carboxylmethyltransferase family protein [Parvularculaceae bacterium]
MTVHRNGEQPDHANTSIHPPTVFIGAVFIGWLARMFSALSFDKDSLFAGKMPLPAEVADAIGGFLIVVGLGLFFWASFAFRRSGEQLPPDTPTHRIIQTGPYRFSRNPIYLAAALVGSGLAVATTNLWMLMMVGLAMVLIHFEVVLKEEAYLERKFGEAYANYKARVRRWI